MPAYTQGNPESEEQFRFIPVGPNFPMFHAEYTHNQLIRDVDLTATKCDVRISICGKYELVMCTTQEVSCHSFCVKGSRHAY
jgi:hypothetical protein